MISYSCQRSRQNQHQHGSSVSAGPRKQPVQLPSQNTTSSGNPCRTQVRSNVRLPRAEDKTRSRNHYVACIIADTDNDGDIEVKLTSNLT